MKLLKKLPLRSYFNYETRKRTSKLVLAAELPDPQIFSLVDYEGKPSESDVVLDNSDITELKKILQKMEEMLVIDDILLKAQRQGRISFYMTAFGETAAILGSVAALKKEDMVFSQYRELAGLYYRGFTIKEITDNCVGNYLDCNKGRQMPIHFTSKKNGYFSVSSPIGTQIPQAAGYGYGLRVSGKDEIATAFIGDGAASQGDFYTGLNFSQTLKSQMLFILRNNGYAISTPIGEQTSGKSILDKALSFGINGLMVDGNDAVAMYKASQFLRNQIVAEKQPAFLEAITYRLSDHSTSDYSVLYRKEGELDNWKGKNDPVTRLRNFLTLSGDIDAKWEEELNQTKKTVKKEVIKCLAESFQEKLPSVDSMFEDVYYELPETLKAQKKELKEHLQLYNEHYDLDKHQ